MKSCASIFKPFYRIAKCLMCGIIYVVLLLIAVFIKKPLLIIANPYGRLGNRLTRWAHVIAFAIENKYAVMDPSFQDYAMYFKFVRNNVSCVYKYSKDFQASKILRAAIAHLSLKASRLATRHINKNITTIIGTDEVIDLSKEEFRNLIAGRKLIFLEGWRFRDEGDLEKHGDEIRNFFTPLDCYVNNVNEVINEMKRKRFVIVGLHIRRTDIGCFKEIIKDYSVRTYGVEVNVNAYYTLSDYLVIMEKIVKCFQPQSVCFYIATDEKIEQLVFKEFTFLQGGGHFIEDLYALSTCDYIIGPASTFSGWAAFYGKVPLLHMQSLNLQISKDKFIIPKAYSGVEVLMPNGDVFIY